MICVADHKQAVTLSSLLSSDLITFLHSDTREDILFELSELAARAGLLEDREAFFRALLARENIMSTGIGMGVAIPHGKIDGSADFFIALGIHSEGILWDAIDGLSVRLVFLIGGPSDAPSKYLKLLSALTQSLRDEARRSQLLQVQTVEEVMSVFSGV
ncbi:PTS sugar transporter subunit IIA [Chlamydia trachomatis]|uniref:PTS sugar transporter subunit IIA n=1 Tax=Chlamydia trachomatis TaxID=813 RepID=UPI0039BE9C41